MGFDYDCPDASRILTQQLQWYEQAVRRDSNVLMFTIIELSTERVLGAGGFCYIDWPNRNEDLSIYIGADNLYIDEIYAPDAARVLVKYGFEELCLHRIWAEIYDIDEEKKKLFELLGFTLDGRHRQTHWSEHQWQDSLFYGLLSSDYAALNNKWFPI